MTGDRVTGVAAFDFDGTLIAGDSFTRFLLGLCGWSRLSRTLATSFTTMFVANGYRLDRDASKADVVARLLSGYPAEHVAREGQVFGARLAERIAAGADGPTATGALRSLPQELQPASPRGWAAGSMGGGAIPGRACRAVPLRSSARLAGTGDGTGNPHGDHAGRAAALIGRLQQSMTLGAGVVRTERSLDQARRELSAVAAELPSAGGGRRAHELANLLDLAGAVLASATARCESRGAHTRLDYPSPDPRWCCRLVQGRPMADGAGDHEGVGVGVAGVAPAPASGARG